MVTSAAMVTMVTSVAMVTRLQRAGAAPDFFGWQNCLWWSPEGACHHVVTTRRGTARRRRLAGGWFFGYFDYPNPNFKAFPVFFCLIMLLEICSQLKYWDWPLTFELTLEWLMKTEKTNDLTAYKIRIMQNKIQRTANKKQLTRTCEIFCLHFARRPGF